MKHTLRCMILLFIQTNLLIGCGRAGDFKDLQNYITQLKQTKPKIEKKNVVEELQFPHATIYQGHSFRGPFAGTETMTTGKANLSNPLLGYPLNILRFVGTSTQGSKTLAYILTPDNMIYQVKIGDVIGDRYGKIINIIPNELKIVESHSENGKLKEEEIVLQLKDNR